MQTLHRWNEPTFIWQICSLFFLARADKAGDSPFLLTFSLHCSCSCSSTSLHLFTSRLLLVYWSTLKIVNNKSIFAFYYANVTSSLTSLAYFLSHDYLLYKFTFLFLSYEGPMVETLDNIICIGSTPTFLYFITSIYHTCNSFRDIDHGYSHPLYPRGTPKDIKSPIFMGLIYSGMWKRESDFAIYLK